MCELGGKGEEIRKSMMLSDVSNKVSPLEEWSH